MQNCKDHNFLPKGQRSETVTTYAFLPKGIQIEDLPKPPAVPSKSARSAR